MARKIRCFLQFNGQDILKDAGTVTKAIADKLANEKYDEFHKNRLKILNKQLGDIDKAISEIED